MPSDAVRSPARRARPGALAALLVLSAGCGGGGALGTDAGVTDDAATAPDAGPVDAGSADAAPRPDAGADAGAGLVGPGIRWLLPSWAVDVTPDGATAVVQDPGSAEGDTYFYDVATGQLRLVTTVGDPARDFATGVSATGRVSAMHGVPVEASVWSATADWVDLPDPFATGCDSDHAAAWDVSADGTVVVGLAWEACSPVAVRWVEGTSGFTATTLERLGSSASASPPTNRATVVSDDGMVAAGFAQTDVVDRWPAIWRADGSGVLLPGTIPDAPGEILAISPDGGVVAGIWNNEGFTYTEAGGVVSLGVLPTGLPGDATYPNAIAADGALVFGGSGGVAFVWTAVAGMRALADLVAASGIEIPSGTTLSNVLAASDDGEIVLGTANAPSGAAMSFVLRLPVSAYGLP